MVAVTVALVEVVVVGKAAEAVVEEAEVVAPAAIDHVALVSEAKGE